MIKRPEILAPAGDMEKLEYAIAYGADAVYLAGSQYGMRTASGNFDDQSLALAIDYAKKRGVRTYITINSMLRNNQIDQLPEFLELLEQLKPDAAIVADLGVLSLVKKHAPSLDIHISTQTSIVNHQAANAWHGLGAKRVVLARELTMDEIAEIRAKTPKELEIECFVHGAMCVSYSGRCLISNYMTGRDANRGNCVQACRFNYAVVEEKRPGEYYNILQDENGTYLFNSKDLNMIEHVPQLIRAGIDSFKIEGRVKAAYYAACITGAYATAVDEYFKNPTAYNTRGYWYDEVFKVSHREYGTGFYFDKEGPGQYYTDSMYIRDYNISAVVLSDGQNEALASLKNRFGVGDTLELLMPGKPPVEFVCGKIISKGEEIAEAIHPQMEITVPLPCPAPKYSILRKAAEPATKGD